MELELFCLRSIKWGSMRFVEHLCTYVVSRRMSVTEICYKNEDISFPGIFVLMTTKGPFSPTLFDEQINDV